ncbi:NUDIX hydrolase [Adhaeribacter aquaticus]|uniref:NUDIX hydrolase n=1 Tax=Adhaeribacter aquaticus TaxID=299567 RepID=UPI00041B8006|nr:NUDIX domain-containing protein [Adhaeribacter aquaticus]
MDHRKLIDKIAWIEIQDGKLLSTRSKGRVKYYFPGGKREAGETDFESLSREITEELTVSLIPGTEQLLGIFQAQADAHPEGIEVKMTCYSCQYEGQIKPAAEIEEVVWLTYQDRDKVSPVDQVILDWLLETNRIQK